MIKAAHGERKKKRASEIPRLSVVQITCASKYISIICERAGFSSPCHFEHVCEKQQGHLNTSLETWL